MSGREPRRDGSAPAQEPSPEIRQDASFDFSSEAQRLAVLSEVLDYRGDVTLCLEDGTSLVGYVFSLERATREPHVKLMTAESAGERVNVPLARIAGCIISGRDTADGRSWEAWVRRHEEKQRLAAQGIDIGDIEPQPEPL